MTGRVATGDREQRGHAVTRGHVITAAASNVSTMRINSTIVSVWAAFWAATFWIDVKFPVSVDDCCDLVGVIMLAVWIDPEVSAYRFSRLWRYFDENELVDDRRFFRAGIRDHVVLWLAAHPRMPGRGLSISSTAGARGLIWLAPRSPLQRAKTSREAFSVGAILSTSGRHRRKN